MGETSSAVSSGAAGPRDRGRLIYFIFYWLGMGSLLPWNFFISGESCRIKTIADKCIYFYVTGENEAFSNFFSTFEAGFFVTLFWAIFITPLTLLLIPKPPHQFENKLWAGNKAGISAAECGERRLTKSSFSFCVYRETRDPATMTLSHRHTQAGLGGGGEKEVYP